MDAILAATAAKPTRPRPEDSEDQYGVCQNPNCWALIVCDGASSSLHARTAARLACDHFIEAMTQSSAISLNGWREQVKQALLNSHRQILQRFPQGDALTTAAAALILPESHHLIVATVGDSPAYYVQGETLTLCTPADVRQVARLQNQKTVIRDGMPILDRALTAALGARQRLEPHVFAAPYAPGDALVLCSDGVPSQTVALISQRRYALTQPMLAGWVRDAAQETGDDATLILARLGADPSHLALETQLEDYATLEPAQKEALLTDLATRHHTPLDSLLHCYESETSEALKMRLYALISPELPRPQRIALADHAARNGQSGLLQRIVESLRNPD